MYESHICMDGVRYRRATGTSNKRLAQQIDKKFEEEVLAQRFQLEQYKPTMKFGELAAKFIAEGVTKPWHLERLKLVLPYFSDFEIAYINKSVIATRVLGLPRR